MKNLVTVLPAILILIFSCHSNGKVNSINGVNVMEYKRISEDGAKQKADDFLKKEISAGYFNLENSETKFLKKLKHPNMGTVYEFEFDGGGIWITAATSKIINFHNKSSKQKTLISIDKAQDTAVKYINRLIGDFENRNFHIVDKKNDEETLSIEWQETKRKYEYSIWESIVDVSVSLLDGKIKSFQVFDFDQKRKTPPKINEKEFKKIVLNKYPGKNISKMSLLEHTSDCGNTWITIWDANIEDPNDDTAYLNSYTINADTGEELSQ